MECVVSVANDFHKSSPYVTDSNNNKKDHSHVSKIAEKYGLRPRTIIKRIQLERSRQDEPERECRKPKPPPLSKYRRKTANARERHRMKEINDAFATLRGVLPSFSIRRHAASGMTKITTLRLAVSYIQALADVLDQGEPIPEMFTLSAFYHNVKNSSSTNPSVGSNINLQSNESSHSTPIVQSQHIHHGPMVNSTTTATATATAIHHHIHQQTQHNPMSSSTDTARSSTSSNTSSLGEFLSDDSSVFEDNLDAFHDIQTLPENDPFALLLNNDNDQISLAA